MERRGKRELALLELDGGGSNLSATGCREMTQAEDDAEATKGVQGHSSPRQTEIPSILLLAAIDLLPPILSSNKLHTYSSSSPSPGLVTTLSAPETLSYLPVEVPFPSCTPSSENSSPSSSRGPYGRCECLWERGG